MSATGDGPTIEVLADRDELGQRGADLVAAALRNAVDRRGVASVAFSGGSTPHPMFTALADADVPWSAVHVLQVDERVAPDGDDDRNLVALREHLLDRVAVPAANVHVMPVGGSAAEAAADSYARTLGEVVGADGALDVVHLGIGDDGHTASLVPGDDVVDERGRSVAATGEYQGRRRVTLTVPPLRAARLQLWLVSGQGKAAAVQAMRDADPSVPATLVLVEDAVVLLDAAAAAGGGPSTSRDA